MKFTVPTAAEYFGDDYAILSDGGCIGQPLALYEAIFDKTGRLVAKRYRFTEQAFRLGFLRLVVYPVPQAFRLLVVTCDPLWMLRMESTP